ncbi:MAG: redox-regulated ATPase YchF [Chloroflexi bacterium RBG_16_57_8]|nr:MAG: redox-regulated ATPase YchF [Chloroflexi bacterium RBG_16_57_8]
MSLDTGIIGLPQSGRTTVFNAITKGQADTGTYSREASANIGVARVPEPRLGPLSDMLKPKRVVAASATYIDIGTSVKDLSTGIGGKLLNQLSAADAMINVVRAFTDDSIPHVLGSLDPDRDIANMNLELTFSDLALLEKRQQRIEESLKGAKPAERGHLLREEELTTRIRASLEKDMAVREMELTPDEWKAISGFQLLSAKPLLIALNIGEDQLPAASELDTQFNSRYARPRCRVVSFCAKLEAELGQLPESDAQVMRSEYGLNESGADRAIRESYALLGLFPFFTIASGEVRAWPISAGTEAAKAAGKIHTDMERGFIRAEVVGYGDLVKCGSIAEAKRRGVLRLEGHNYVVQDGDVITFLFNV